MHHKDKETQKEGIALITILIFTTALVIVAGGILSLINAESNMARYQLNSTKAFFLAEAGMERAIAELRDTGALPTGGGPDLEFQVSETGLSDCAELDNINIRIQCRSTTPGTYEVTSNAEVGEAERSVQAVLQVNPPSEVFNYVHYSDQWSMIGGANWPIEWHIKGNVRTNGTFLLHPDSANPTEINGEIYANRKIFLDHTLNGMAATQQDGEYIYQHPNSVRINMPDVEALPTLRMRATGTLRARRNDLNFGNVGGTIDVIGFPTAAPDSAYDWADATANGTLTPPCLYLEGTDTDPIDIDGVVVVDGQVIIKGKVTGQGTIYATGNIYVAGDLEYVDGPTTRLESEDPEIWMGNNRDKDMLVLASAEHIVLGYPHGGGCSGGAALIPADNFGSEDVGTDGVPGVLYPDDGSENSGDLDFREDFDEDGLLDPNYPITRYEYINYLSEFYNSPAYWDKVMHGSSAYDHSYVTTYEVSKIDAVCFSNKCIDGYVRADLPGTEINGALIGKHVLINTERMNLQYDERIHSRYRDLYPNFFNNLGLPEGTGADNTVAVLSWWEGEE